MITLRSLTISRLEVFKYFWGISDDFRIYIVENNLRAFSILDNLPICEISYQCLKYGTAVWNILPLCRMSTISAFLLLFSLSFHFLVPWIFVVLVILSISKSCSVIWYTILTVICNTVFDKKISKKMNETNKVKLLSTKEDPKNCWRLWKYFHQEN